MPIGDVEERFDSSRCLAYMTVLHNRDRWELSNVSIQGEKIAVYERYPLAGTHDHIDSGMILFDRAAFEGKWSSYAFDLQETTEC